MFPSCNSISSSGVTVEKFFENLLPENFDYFDHASTPEAPDIQLNDEKPLFTSLPEMKNSGNCPFSTNDPWWGTNSTSAEEVFNLGVEHESKYSPEEFPSHLDLDNPFPPLETLSSIDASSAMTFEPDFSRSMLDAASSSSCATTPSDSCTLTEPPKRSRRSLADLSDEDKYRRMRKQNNIASQKYRSDKKKKKGVTNTQLEQQLLQNEQLQHYLQQLKGDYEKCKEIENTFYKYGLGHLFSKLNL